MTILQTIYQFAPGYLVPDIPEEIVSPKELVLYSRKIRNHLNYVVLSSYDGSVELDYFLVKAGTILVPVPEDLQDSESPYLRLCPASSENYFVGFTILKTEVYKYVKSGILIPVGNEEILPYEYGLL